MKSEKEILELYNKLDHHKLIKALDSEGFLSYSEKGGHWLDCLDWVLNGGN